MAIIPIAGSLSCATDLTQRRSTSADGVALLVTTAAQAESGYGTDVRAIDGVKVDGSKFKLVAGRHSVEAEGHCRRNSRAVAPFFGAVGAAAAHAMSDRDCDAQSGALKACFIARPDRTYEVRTYAEGGVWMIEVVDQTTTYDVKSPCKSSSPTPSP